MFKKQMVSYFELFYVLLFTAMVISITKLTCFLLGVSQAEFFSMKMMTGYVLGIVIAIFAIKKGLANDVKAIILENYSFFAHYDEVVDEIMASELKQFKTSALLYCLFWPALLIVVTVSLIKPTIQFILRLKRKHCLSSQ